MPFTLIKGTLSPELGKPDGDSMRFVPDDPSPIFSLRRRGRGPKINQNNGSIQLRFEAIDTVESAALEPFASGATKSNIELATGGQDAGRGHIFSSQLGPNGRPIAFVFAGESNLEDGSSVFLTPDDIMSSINIKQLERGHAYPLYYDTLFDDLRERCTGVSNAAKSLGHGVWAADKTNVGVEWSGDVGTLEPIFPKLWRRLQKYVKDDTFFDPTAPMANLKDWLEQTGDERVSIPTQSIFTGFDNVIETTDTSVKMLFEPHELVVISQ